jgi:uncharacterized protein YdhG (YjbR/CyaY superfamily)
MKRPPRVTATIDEYLARLPADKRAALRRLRTIIRAAVPRVEECISYQLPAFRLDGRMLMWFGASTKQCALYPGAFPIAAHRDALARYDTSKGTIRFDPKQPLPLTLVRELVRSRVAEHAARTATRRKRSTRSKSR